MYCKDILPDMPIRPIRSVLLLQGPVGPFFADLQRLLQDQGLAVRRVLFNAADAAFARGLPAHRFYGDDATWASWLSHEMLTRTPDLIIMFGANRPAHIAARNIAQKFGIQVLCLEEGYLRSGYITCEEGGNNQHSPLLGWQMPCPTTINGSGAPDPWGPANLAFPVMSVWGLLYYCLRDTLSPAVDRALYHRKHDGLVQLIRRWPAHMARRLIARMTERRKLRSLRERGGYILIPLQVPTDSQLLTAARGWTSGRLITAALHALSQAGADQTVLFKLHPLDTDGHATKRAILRQVRDLGIDPARVHVVHSGKIGDLTQHADGMIVINSTSAFSALAHKVPVLVLGEAVFRHDSVVTTGQDEADVTRFFQIRQTRPWTNIKAFTSDLKRQSLLPGDFYLAGGRAVAARSIAARVGRIDTAKLPAPAKAISA